MTFIKIIYTLTIMAFLIMLVGFGISAFYQPPEYPAYQNCYDLSESAREECETENTNLREAYNTSVDNHYRNVFLISYPCGLLFVAIGLFLKTRLDIIKPGFIFGGMGTIIYAISQSDLADGFRFAGIAVGLIVLIIIGYRTLLEREDGAKVTANDSE